MCNAKYSVPKIIPIDFHNGSNYYDHFIIKELAEQFEKQFTCSGENIEKQTTFKVPIEKEPLKLQELIKTKKKAQNMILHITIC